MRRLFPVLILAAVVVAIAAAPALALDARLVSVGPSFSQPIYVTGSPGDSSRLYVVERTGRIELLRGGTSQTFLDISSKVSSSDAPLGPDRRNASAMAPTTPATSRVEASSTSQAPSRY